MRILGIGSRVDSRKNPHIKRRDRIPGNCDVMSRLPAGFCDDSFIISRFISVTSSHGFLFPPLSLSSLTLSRSTSPLPHPPPYIFYSFSQPLTHKNLRISCTVAFSSGRPTGGGAITRRRPSAPSLDRSLKLDTESIHKAPASHKGNAGPIQR